MFILLIHFEISTTMSLIYVRIGIKEFVAFFSSDFSIFSSFVNSKKIVISPTGPIDLFFLTYYYTTN